MKSPWVVLVMAVGVWLFSSSAMAIGKTANHASAKKTAKNHARSASHKSHGKTAHGKHDKVAAGKHKTAEGTLAKYGLDTDSKNAEETSTPKSTLEQYDLDTGSSDSAHEGGGASGAQPAKHGHSHKRSSAKHKKASRKRSSHHK